MQNVQNALRDLISALVQEGVLRSDSPIEFNLQPLDQTKSSWQTDTLDANGAWAPAWLETINQAVRQHIPTGVIVQAGKYGNMTIGLISGLLWDRMLERQDLTDAQRSNIHQSVFVDGFPLAFASAGYGPGSGILPVNLGSVDRSQPFWTAVYTLSTNYAERNNPLFKTEQEVANEVIAYYARGGCLPSGYSLTV